jgi:predicted kinase
MEKILYIVRGCPNAGKSTFAKTLVKRDYCHKEADMFFIDRDGNYNFKPSQIKDAHKWCQEEMDFLMRLEHSPVVVSNTFTQEWEMEPYFELAKTYGYKVFSIVVENRHGGINQHDVPEEVLTKMRDRFEIKL